MASEITNFFLIFRDRFGKEKEGKSVIATVNVVSLFISYTVLRIVMLPITEWHLIYRLWNGYNYESPTLAWKIGLPIIIFLFAGIIILNYFWYSFIVRGAIKLATAGDTGNIGVEDSTTKKQK